MNEREIRRLEGQSEMHREWRRESAGYSEAGEAETTPPEQDREYVCSCCETAGPPGAVVYCENDGHYLCVDSDACLWRFRELMRRWHAARDPYGPLTVYDDAAEFPW